MKGKTSGEVYPHKTSKKKIRLLMALVIFSAIILFESVPVFAATEQYYMHANTSAPYGSTYEELSNRSLGTLTELDSGVLVDYTDATFPQKFMKESYGSIQNINGQWHFSVWLKTSGNNMNFVKVWAKVYKEIGGSEILLATTPTTSINLTTTYANANWDYNAPSAWINGTDDLVVEFWVNAPDVGSGNSNNKHILLGYDSSTENSYVNMTPTTVGTVDITAGDLAPVTEKQGKKAVQMGNLTFTPSGGTADVSTITIYFNGTDIENIRRVYIVDDENNNGDAEPSEPKLDIKYFEGYDNVTFGTSGTSLFNVPDGQEKHIIVVYDFSGSALLAVDDEVGVTFNASGVTMNFGTISSDNFPFNSSLTKVTRQEMDQFANVYAFLNKPVYLFGHYSNGGNSAYDGAETPCKDDVLWPGCDTFIDSTADNDQDSNTDYMRESTTIRTRILVVDGRGQPMRDQRVNMWVVTDNGHKINNSGYTDINGTVQIELWGWPDFENTTTSDSKARFPVHSGQNTTLNDTTPINNEAAYIYANFTSRQYYNVFIDADDDGISDTEVSWLAYTMFDTFPIEDKNPDHCEQNYKDIHTTSMVGDGNMLSRNNSDSDAICPDCHGWDYRAGPSKISSGTDVADIIKYSVTHPRAGSNNAARCDDPDCHTSTLGADQPIPGYSAGNAVINNASYPDATICSTSNCHSSTGKAPKYVDDVIPPSGEGHCYINDVPDVTQGVQCKFCHMQNFHFITSRQDIPAFSPPGGDGAYPGTCFEGCHVAIAWHNGSVDCSQCHFKASTAPMHKKDMKVDRRYCYQSCHGNYSVNTVTSKDGTSLSVSRVWLNTTFHHSTELINGSKWNTSTFNDITYPGQFYWDNSGTDFPQASCEFCHSEEHTGAVFYVRNPMGKLLQFNGKNIQNSDITHTSNWCAGCHYQGYSSDGKNYDDMISAFNNTNIPIPPEISGNVSYGPITGSNPGAQGITDYVEHSAWFMNNGTGGDYSDAMCFECHANGIDINEGHRKFQHNVTIGFGGPLCASCHNNTLKGIIDAGGALRLDSQAMETPVWSHFNLSNKTGSNKSYVSSIQASCWACHNTSTGGRPVPSEHPASYNQPRNCTDCHKDGNYSASIVVEHIPAGYNGATETPTDPNGYCTLCHNNSLLSYSSLNTTNFSTNPNATIAHYSTNNTLMTPANRSKDCIWCHFQNSDNTAWSTPVDPRIAIPLHVGKTNTECHNCHVDGGASKVSTAGWSFHDESVKRGSSGGGNCTNCHDVGQSPPTTGGLVNITAMGDIDAVHKDLNSGASSPSGYPADNYRCWACHGNGSEPSASDHPTEYNNPRSCENCHINTSLPFSALQVSEHYWNGGSINTSAVASCYECHNASEMMIGPDLDPDGPGSIDGVNGGNNSVSHYGKKRTDYPLQDTNDYCYRCHDNSSVLTVFPYSNSGNSTIANHSTNYNNSNPGCADCHGTGRIHNDTLYKPVFELPNSTYCTDTCHGAGGTATIVDLEQHNSTSGLNCTQCHLSTDSNIHPVQYLEQTGNTWSNTNMSAVNCTTCHQGSGLGGDFISAPIVPVLNHSNNPYSGAMWNNSSQPAFWDNTSQQSSCNYCHGNIALHNNSGLGKTPQGSNSKNQSLPGGTWCANCHYSGAPEYSVDQFYPQPPEVTNSTGFVPDPANDGTPFKDHTTDLQTVYDDDKCISCHDSGATNSLEFSHNVAEGGGGPDCIGCHNAGQSPPAPGSLVNFTAMNDPGSIHRDLNKDATTALNPENKKCWACHGDGTEPGGHPERYANPYTCTDCHEEGGNQNLNFTPSNILNVTQHFWNGSSVNTTAVVSCYDCHNASEMMLGLDLDPDGPDNNINGGVNGGNFSVSHYGKKRTDYQALEGSNDYCYKCHDNSTATSVWPYSSSVNATIANHSLSYPSTNPDCGDCHSTGRIHNSTLYKPVFELPDSNYCLACHGPGGNASINNLERHNDTTGLECTQCHLNSSNSIHPVRYLQQGLTWDTSKVSAVNCTTCHQNSGLGGFESAPMVPAPMNHSTDLYSGALWNGSQAQYWDNTSQQSSCDYCHGNSALHNSSGLGKITIVMGSNTIRQDLATGTWCANCHYAGAPEYAGTSFDPEPPEILNSSGKVPAVSRNGTAFIDHSGYLGSGYNDSVCKSCHDNDLDAGATSLNLSHDVGIGTLGGPDCVNCHNVGKSAPKPGALINNSGMNDSNAIHSGLNSGASSPGGYSTENFKCWACHGDGTEPGSHPVRYNNPYTCTDCHEPDGDQNLNFTPNFILNVTQHYWNATSINTIAVTSCYECHNRSEMMLGTDLDPDGADTGVNGGANGGNESVSHYGKKRTDYPLQDTDEYCYECHNNVSATSVWPYSSTGNATIANHSMNYNNSNPGCKDCHFTGKIHNSTLDKPAFDLPNSTYCLTCHGAGGTATIKDLEQHNGTTGVNCTQCHLNTSKNIHPVQYLEQDGATWSYTNTTPVNCTTCHQGSGLGGDFSSAPMVRLPVWHSNNTYSGALWNGIQAPFWDNTSQQSSCDYCHGNQALHNTSGLGISALIQANNSKNQSLIDSYWCANCHYDGKNPGDAPGGKYEYKGDLLNPVPPEILNLTGLVPANASDDTLFQNHTLNVGGDWSDARCKSCHGKDLPSGVTSGEFLHNLNQSQPETGGPDCLVCHVPSYNGQDRPADDMMVNSTAFTNYSVHRGLNSGANSTVTLSDNRSKACWACHGDGTQPVKHPTEYINPKPCEFCHVNYNFNATPVYRHYPGGVFAGGVVYDNSDANRTCVSCHNNTIVDNLNLTFGPDPEKVKNSSVSHYAVNRSTSENNPSLVTSVLLNTTDMKGCQDCHKVGTEFGSFGSIYGNAGGVPAGHNDMGAAVVDCEESCHNSYTDSVRLPVNLHNNSISIYVGTNSCYSTGCHTAPPPDEGPGGRR